MINFCFKILFIILAILFFPLITSSSDLTANLNKEIDKESINTINASDNINNLINNIDFDIPKEYKADIISTLQMFPIKYLNSLQRLKYKPDSKRRGLGSSKSIYINFDRIDTKKELKKVLIHEIGHVFDLGYLKSTKGKEKSNFKDGSMIIYQDDPSVEFYLLCWKNENKQNGKCGEKDFPSGYAKSDPFEDFSESFLLYIENNASFLQMAKESKIMMKKYFLMRKYLKTTPKSEKYKFHLKNERVWDLTVVE